MQASVLENIYNSTIIIIIIIIIIIKTICYKRLEFGVTNHSVRRDRIRCLTTS